MKVNWGEIGYITYKRTYSRRINKNKKEEFIDTVNRELNAIEKQLKLQLTATEKEAYIKMRVEMKGSVAGRFMWQLGTKTVNKLGLLSLQNCAFVLVNEPIRPFTWTMDCLMLGSGVGYNIQREYVYEIPKVKKKIKIIRKDTKDADFIVPDSREGWVKLLHKVLHAHFISGEGFSYSTVCIRSKGSPIEGFGGTASGPEDLCWGIKEISGILNKRSGKKVRPIDCLDIMNIIGAIVVAGNVRRSAQIAIGDMDDLQFLNAKRWDLGNIPNWRSMSNNSVVCNDFSQLPEQFWEGYLGNGEPYGLINLKLAKEIGRVGETQYPDPDVCGFNPCVEQPLATYETCCLAEGYLCNMESLEEAKNIYSLLYKICKHSLRLKCHHPETEKVVHKNMRMGLGATGYLQSSKKQKAWLPKIYKHLRELDKKYSRKMGWPESIKLTTVKPSGTLSLLAGVTPGAHPGFSEYYIRRIRIDSGSELVDVCRNHNYPIEYQRNLDGTEDHSTVVVEFPCKFPKHTVFVKDVSAVDQLEVIKELQTNWSDNGVSCTVYYKKEELEDVRGWLVDNYNVNLKAVSFLLHQDHGFDQAPLESITKEDYLKRKKESKPIFDCEIEEKDLKDSFECEGGACPIK